MVFDPSVGEGAEQKLVPNGEYRFKISEVIRDVFSGGTEYLFFKAIITASYDGGECSESIGKTVKRKFFFTENATRFYRQFCRDLGVGVHDADNLHDTSVPGLNATWMGREFVANLTGELDDNGYPNYSWWQPRPLNEAEASGAQVDNSEIPF